VTTAFSIAPATHVEAEPALPDMPDGYAQNVTTRVSLLDGSQTVEHHTEMVLTNCVGSDVGPLSKVSDEGVALGPKQDIAGLFDVPVMGTGVISG